MFGTLSEAAPAAAEHFDGCYDATSTLQRCPAPPAPPAELSQNLQNPRGSGERIDSIRFLDSLRFLDLAPSFDV